MNGYHSPNPPPPASPPLDRGACCTASSLACAYHLRLLVVGCAVGIEYFALLPELQPWLTLLRARWIPSWQHNHVVICSSSVGSCVPGRLLWEYLPCSPTTALPTPCRFACSIGNAPAVRSFGGSTSNPPSQLPTRQATSDADRFVSRLSLAPGLQRRTAHFAAWRFPVSSAKQQALPQRTLPSAALHFGCLLR